jgi:nucleolar MIF4G domain-containing protein 1
LEEIQAKDDGLFDIVSLPEPRSKFTSGHDEHNKGSSTKKFRVRGLSRKEARKQGRSEQKQKRAQFFSTRKRQAEDDELPESPQRKRARTNDMPRGGQNLETQAVSPPKGSQQKINEHSPRAMPKKDSGAMEKRKEKNIRAIVPPRSQAEEREEAYISLLEKKLGYTRTSRKKKNVLENDGLDGEYVFVPGCSES